jgi:hypothetical protein
MTRQLWELCVEYARIAPKRYRKPNHQCFDRANFSHPSTPSSSTFSRSINLNTPLQHPEAAALTLESSVLEQLLKVGLEPSTSLRSRGQRIRVTAVSVVAAGARVASTVALSTRLDPNDSINKSITSVGSRGASETGTLDIAPVTPGLLSSRLNAAAALVDDEVRVPAVGLEQRGDGVDVQLLVEVLVALGVRRGDGGVVAVVVGDVGGQAAEGGGFAGAGVDFGEHLGGGCKVGFPA